MSRATYTGSNLTGLVLFFFFSSSSSSLRFSSSSFSYSFSSPMEKPTDLINPGCSIQFSSEKKKRMRDFCQKGGKNKIDKSPFVNIKRSRAALSIEGLTPLTMCYRETSGGTESFTPPVRQRDRFHFIHSQGDGTFFLVSYFEWRSKKRRAKTFASSYRIHLSPGRSAILADGGQGGYEFSTPGPWAFLHRKTEHSPLSLSS